MCRQRRQPANARPEGRRRVALRSTAKPRITVDPKIFGGKSIIRGRRLAVEHVLGMLSAADDIDTILEGCPWLERDDVPACLAQDRAENFVGPNRGRRL